MIESLATAIVGLLLALFNGLIFFVLKRIFGRLDAMDTKLSHMNGSVRELKVWKDDHKEDHGRRVGEVREEIRGIWAYLNTKF